MQGTRRFCLELIRDPECNGVMFVIKFIRLITFLGGVLLLKREGIGSFTFLAGSCVGMKSVLFPLLTNFFAEILS